MRIQFAIHAWHPEGKGGTELHAHSVARALCLKGHQVGVFARTGRKDRPEYEITTEWEGSSSVTRINNNFRELPNYEWIYRNRRIHEAFDRELGEFKPDIVHIHHLTGLSTTIVEAIKARNLPVVMTLHDFWTVCPRGQRMTKDLKLCETVDRNTCFTCLGGLWPYIFSDRDAERTVVDIRGNLSPALLAEWDRHMAYILNLCDLLICPSAFHRERMLDFPLDPERVLALPHGLDHAPFDGQLRGLSKPVRIGFVGSVIPIKGVHILVDAFKRLGRAELSLEIHGEIAPFHGDTTYGERLRAMTQGMSNVRFHGAYDPDKIGAVLEKIDILVVPSLWWETFCLTIREGLLAGIPVLASDLGAMREALDGERDGILFRAGDPDDLRFKLEQLIDDSAFRERFYNRGGSVKSIDQYADELEEVYAQAIRISKKRSGKIVVAPPSFPSHRPQGTPPMPVLPWDRLDIGTHQRGPAQVAVQTRLPSQEQPVLGVKLHLRDGDKDLGTFDVEIDMKSFAETATKASGPPPLPLPAPPPMATSPASEPQRAEETGRSRHHLVPAERPSLKKVAIQRPPAVTREDIRAGKVRTVTWRPSDSEGLDPNGA